MTSQITIATCGQEEALLALPSSVKEAQCSVCIVLRPGLSVPNLLHRRCPRRCLPSFPRLRVRVVYGIMENEMETAIVYCSYIGMMEKKIEATIMGSIGFRV